MKHAHNIINNNNNSKKKQKQIKIISANSSLNLLSFDSYIKEITTTATTTTTKVKCI